MNGNLVDPAWEGVDGTMRPTGPGAFEAEETVHGLDGFPPIRFTMVMGEDPAGYLRIGNGSPVADEPVDAACVCADLIEFHRVGRSESGGSMSDEPTDFALTDNRRDAWTAFDQISVRPARGRPARTPGP